MDVIEKKRLRQEKKNSLRRQYRQTCREALFIKDYIHTKYADAYEEACAFYNYINSMYPTKTDLRKTQEFKALRMGFTFVAKNKDTVVSKPLQVYQPISDLSEQNFIIHCYKIPEKYTDPPQTETPQPLQTETSEPPQTETPDPPQTETPDPPQTETPDPPQTETPDPPQTETPDPPQTETHQPGKIFQLRIPLLSPALVTQTLETVTQETIEENILTVTCNQTVPPDDVQPVFNDLIPQETYEAIVKELRQDPDLSKLMDDIELDTGDDIDMIDVDLPIEDDRLEQELYDFW